MSRPGTTPLDAEQQVLFNALSVPMMNGFAGHWKTAAERLNWERQQKETNLNNELTTVRTKVDGALGQVAGLNQKFTLIEARVSELEKLLTTLNAMVHLDNENYAKVLSHTKSVLATVQNTTRDLCTDTKYLGDEMGKIHSTIRIVPSLSTDFKKFEVRLDVAENDILELKNPPTQKSYNREIFIIAAFVAIMAWLIMSCRGTNVPAIGY